MVRPFQIGGCVRIPDGRAGRVREEIGDEYRVRVCHMTRKTHQVLTFSRLELELVDCPKGWMSPGVYHHYLETTRAKMRLCSVAKSRSQSDEDR